MAQIKKVRVVAWRSTESDQLCFGVSVDYMNGEVSYPVRTQLEAHRETLKDTQND